MNIPKDSSKEFLILNKEEAIGKSLLNEKIFSFVWCKLYKKDIFDKIRFPVGKYYEDVFVMVDILFQANSIVACPVSKYYYRQRKGSIIKDKFHYKSMHIIEGCEYNLKIITEKYPNLVEKAKTQLLLANYSVLSKIVVCKYFRKIPEYKTILLTLKNNYKFVMKNKVFTKKDKLKAMALRISILVFKCMLLLNLKFIKRNLFD